MVHFYTNRELSEILDINLARWKRWSRYFLSPDPLGGMQSGYARQYLFKDLFKVFLGGHLLAHLKLPLAQSRRVVTDLSPWLSQAGFFDLSGPQGGETETVAQGTGYHVFFCAQNPSLSNHRYAFAYLIRRTVGIHAARSAPDATITETYEETRIPCQATNAQALLQNPHLYVISLSGLFEHLIAKLVRRPR